MFKTYYYELKRENKDNSTTIISNRVETLDKAKGRLLELSQQKGKPTKMRIIEETWNDELKELVMSPATSMRSNKIKVVYEKGGNDDYKRTK